MVHGIYATDSRKLSVRAAFPTVWEAEERGGGSVVRGFFKKTDSISKDDYALGDTGTILSDVSVFAFKDGIRTITDALVRQLRNNSQVQLQSGVDVTSLRLNPLRKTFEVR